MKASQHRRASVTFRLAWIFLLFSELLFSSSASAVPSYTRRYGEQCSTCHTVWGALTGAGVTFRLSGYRAINGKDLTPAVDDQKISKVLSVPGTLPLSFVTGVGYDSRNEKREPAAAPSTTSTGASLAVEDASIFMTAPLGRHLSTFVEFPMYETRAWEFTPLGQAEVNAHPGRNIKFSTEKPGFEVAKFFWNNVLGDSAPRDSVNLLFGITHMPLAYSPGKVRLSVNQYLVYERTAMSLLAPRTVESMTGQDSNDVLMRLSEPQGLFEVNGMLTFGKPVTDVGSRETLWAEYHLGLTNGSNDGASNKTQKDMYGRFVVRYYNQSFGLFAFHSNDTYGDRLNMPDATGIINTGPDTGVINPNWMGGSNRSTRWGPDMTLSLVPWKLPLWLENQYMMNSESNPTGYGREFKWKGGFHQLNWQVGKNAILYGRYDYLRADAYDDVAAGGRVNTAPKEHDYILGYQKMVDENMKFIAEARHHLFEDAASGLEAHPGKLSDNGVTLRLMMGF